MKATLTIALLAGVLAIPMVSVAAPADAPQPPAREGRERPGPRGELMERMQERIEALRKAVSELDLTDAQKGQIKEAVEAFRKKVADFRESHKDELEAIRKELQAAREAKDPEKAKAAMEKLRTLMEDAPKPHELMEAVKGILTPEQNKALQEKLGPAKERMEERRERRQERREDRQDRREERRENRGGAGANG